MSKSADLLSVLEVGECVVPQLVILWVLLDERRHWAVQIIDCTTTTSSSLRLLWLTTTSTIVVVFSILYTGNESVPIQLAQCRFAGLTISNAKILIYLSNKIHTHTHPLNGPFFGTTEVSRYRKEKPIWILLKQETEWQRHQLGYMQVCTSLQTDNHTSTSPLSFFTDALPSAQMPIAV